MLQNVVVKSGGTLVNLFKSDNEVNTRDNSSAMIQECRWELTPTPREFSRQIYWNCIQDNMGGRQTGVPIPFKRYQMTFGYGTVYCCISKRHRIFIYKLLRNGYLLLDEYIFLTMPNSCWSLVKSMSKIPSQKKAFYHGYF